MNRATAADARGGDWLRFGASSESVPVPLRELMRLGTEGTGTISQGNGASPQLPR